MKPIYIIIGLIVFFLAWRFNLKLRTKKAIQTAKQNGKRMFLVDVRQPEELSGGQVAGSVNIPLGQVASRINDFRDKEQVVVFCRSGARASQAASILKSAGINNVINGGSWQNVAEIIQ